MQAVVDIKFDELLKLVKKLPDTELSKLKSALDKGFKQDKKKLSLKKLLLEGPVFSEKQLELISQTRKSIDQWRVK
jgi:hypothetical protein